MSISIANIVFWSLMDDSEAQDAEDYQVTCDDCATMISEDKYDQYDGLCEACYDSVHFTCSACGEEFHCDDHHEIYRDLCEECGDMKRTEVADELWSEIVDLAGSWSGEDYEIARLRKLLAYAGKLK